MRIRKKPLRASFAESVQPVAAPQLLKVSANENVQLESKETSDLAERRISRKMAVMEPALPGLKSKPALAEEQSKPPDISMLPKPHGHVKLVAGAHGGSNWSGDPGRHLHDGQKDDLLQHVRQNRNEGAPALTTTVQIGQQLVVAARLSTPEINGNQRPYEQGEESKGLTTTEKFPFLVEELRSSLDPKLTELDSEVQQIHPSKAPEASLLHSLYLQLLVAGSEGMILADLFTSFEMQSALPRFASDWKQQVRFHLKNNPHFNKVHGYYLLCNNQLDVLQQLPKSPGTVDAAGHIRPSQQSDLADHLAPAVQPAFSKDNHEGVQTRRRAYQKAIEAALTQSAMDYENMQQSPANTLVADSSASQPAAIIMPLSTLSKKRKASLDDLNRQMDDHRRNPIRGGLKAMQNRILLEARVQTGVPCARREESKNWSCPMMAMPGYTVCKHHRNLRRMVLTHQQKGKTRKIALKEPVSKTCTSKTESLHQRSTKAKNGSNAAGLGGTHASEALTELQPSLEESLNTWEATKDHAATIPVVQEEAETGNSPQIFLASAILRTSSDAPRSSSMSGQAPPSSFPPLDCRSVQRKRATPGPLMALHAKIVAEKGVIRSGVRCARTDSGSSNRRGWQCPLDAKVGRTFCEHHQFLSDKKNARYAATQKVKIAAAKRERYRKNKRKLGMHKQRNQVPAVLLQHPPPSTSLPLSPTDVKDEPALNANNPPQGHSSGNADHADDSNEPLIMLMKAPKRWHVAAKKTAANMRAAKKKTAVSSDASAVNASPQVHENRLVIRP